MSSCGESVLHFQQHALCFKTCKKSLMTPVVVDNNPTTRTTLIPGEGGCKAPNSASPPAAVHHSRKAPHLPDHPATDLSAAWRTGWSPSGAPWRRSLRAACVSPTPCLETPSCTSHGRTHGGLERASSRLPILLPQARMRKPAATPVSAPQAPAPPTSAPPFTAAVVMETEDMGGPETDPVLLRPDLQTPDDEDDGEDNDRDNA